MLSYDIGMHIVYKYFCYYYHLNYFIYISFFLYTLETIDNINSIKVKSYLNKMTNFTRLFVYYNYISIKNFSSYVSNKLLSLKNELVCLLVCIVRHAFVLGIQQCKYCCDNCICKPTQLTITFQFIIFRQVPIVMIQLLHFIASFFTRIRV